MGWLFGVLGLTWDGCDGGEKEQYKNSVCGCVRIIESCHSLRYMLHMGWLRSGGKGAIQKYCVAAPIEMSHVTRWGIGCIWDGCDGGGKEQYENSVCVVAPSRLVQL